MNKKSNESVYIIAELSANHNNDFDIAADTIKAMAASGADAVKVQTYTADSLSIDVDNEYFKEKTEGLWKGYRPYDLYNEAAMPYEWQPKLQKIAHDLGLEFFSSPFDKEGVDFLETLNVPRYKIASFEITDIPLIEYTAKTGKPIIMSTGVAGLEDIQLAVDTCRKAGNNEITLLKCTSNYPATIEDANLLTISDLKDRFGTKVGVSDHTMGHTVPVVAVSLGAVVVEKHFILDRSMGGPDSAFSMEPNEFKVMVEEVRKAEKALGRVTYDLSEKDKLRRRSLFVVQDIKKGEQITFENVRSVRPGNGMSPRYLPYVIGRKTILDVKKGTPFKKDFIEFNE
jgi:pseudaminic acid synthase